jgi:hypothetical protein
MKLNFNSVTAYIHELYTNNIGFRNSLKPEGNQTNYLKHDLEIKNVELMRKKMQTKQPFFRPRNNKSF